MKTKGRVILLTACVNPNGMIYTKIQDCKTREEQYKEAIKWYLETTNEQIVFVENTLCDFSHEFSEYIESGRFEYITFNGNDYDKALGKGYGEAMIIRRALDQSILISENETIIKITGRLKVKNIINILQHIDTKNILYANTDLINGHALCNSTFFITPKEFVLEHFLKNIDIINDSKGYYFEHLLYDSMIQWKISGGEHSDFKLPVIIDGFSGTTGKKYIKPKRYIVLKSYIKYLAHKKGIYRNHFKSNIGMY